MRNLLNVHIIVRPNYFVHYNIMIKYLITSAERYGKALLLKLIDVYDNNVSITLLFPAMCRTYICLTVNVHFKKN